MSLVLSDYSKLSVDEIRNLIVQDSDGEISLEEIKEVKGKNNLITMHQTLLTLKDSNEEIELEEVSMESLEPQNEQNVEPEEKIPHYYSTEWEEYVMQQFSPKELFNGNPTVNGLRRVAAKLFGGIHTSRPTSVFPATDVNGPGRATVVYEVIFGNGFVFQGTGDCWHGNADDKFAVFPVAMAETRAEARALRKALCISKVAAEELTSKDTASICSNYVESTAVNDWQLESINSSQVLTLMKLCERLGIDLDKFINSGSKQYSTINDVSRETASKMIVELNNFQQNVKSIPANLKKESVNEG